MASLRVGVLGLGLLGLLGPASAAAPDPLAALGRALAEGRHADVARLAARLPARLRDEGRLALARVDLERGRSREAERRLRALVSRPAAGLDARVLLGRLLAASGRGEEAARTWHRLFDDYEARRLDRRSPRALVAVAVAARHLGSFQDASDLLRQAVEESGDRSLAARLEWGALSLEKSATDGALRDARAALAIDAGSPEAHLLLARATLEAEGDLPAVGREIDAALAIHPRHPGALALQGRLALEASEPGVGERIARALLDGNPGSPEGHLLLAGAALLRDDGAGFARERDAALGSGAPPAGLFLGLAELLTAHHRYDEARGLYEAGLARAPRHGALLSGLGLTLMRLGEEEAARATLGRACAADPYDRRSFDLLRLLDKVLPAEYRALDLGRFRLRAPRGEAAALARLMRPALDEEWAEMTARYGVAPPTPVLVDVLADPRHWAVRVAGTPDLAASGATFGRVVALRSPATVKLNWRMVLWHEVAHVFSMAASGQRVPRWFAEGLAEHETERRDPSWRRHREADLAGALGAGLLPSVGELGRALLQARTVGEAVVVYQLSAELVGLIVRRWGFPAVVDALRRFKAGQASAEVLAAVTGLAPAALDELLRDELRRRLAPWLGKDGEGHVARMEGARALLATGHRDEALAMLRQAAARDPGKSEPEEVIGRLLLAAGAVEEGLAAVERAARLDVHDPALPALLVERRAARGEWSKVREAASLSEAIRPCDGPVRLAAARASVALGDWRRAVDEAELGLACAPPRTTALRGLLALGLAMSGERESGARLAREVLAEEPGNREAARALDQAAAGR